MKVLHVLYQSLPNTAGSSIRSRDIINAQLKIGLKPIVITSPFQDSFNYGKTKEEVDGVVYYRTFSNNNEIVSEKKSNIFGQFKNTLSDKLSLNYNFSIDNNLDTLNYNEIATTLSLNNFVTTFNFTEENTDSTDINTVSSTTSYNLNEEHFFTFKTRKNRKINLTEYYDLVYEYKNDCLVAGIKYNIANREISLEFAKLDPNVLTTFTQFAILPENHLAGIDPAQLQQHPFWQFPIGSGAFKLEEVKMNDFAKFVPNEDFHGGVANFDVLAYPSYDGDGNLIKNAAAGKMDYGFTKNVADVGALNAMSNMMTKAVDIPYTRMLWVMQYPKP